MLRLLVLILAMMAVAGQACAQEEEYGRQNAVINPFPDGPFNCPAGTNQSELPNLTIYYCGPSGYQSCTTGNGANGLPSGVEFCFLIPQPDAVGASANLAGAKTFSGPTAAYLLRRQALAQTPPTPISGVNANGKLGLGDGVTHVSTPLAADQGLALEEGAMVHVNGIVAAPGLAVGTGTALRGSGQISAPTTVTGSLHPGNSPGTLTFTRPVTMHPGSLLVLETDGTGTGNGGGNYSRVIVRGASFNALGGIVMPLLRGLTHTGLGDGAPPTNTYTPPLGQLFAGVVTADGGIIGGFEGLEQPYAGLAPGTRFDTIYRPNAVDLVVTPASYANLAAAGLAQRGNQRAIGAVLDAARPDAGTLPVGAQKQVFDTLYALNPGAITYALDQLSPMIYADASMAGRLTWNAIEGTVTRRMAATRGQPGAEALVWVDALGAYGGVRGGAGSPGASSGLGGVVAGYDRELDPSWRVGASIAAGGGRAWSQTGSRANLSAGQLTAYAQWQQAAWFAEAQAGLMLLQANATRPMPSFGVTAQGNQTGFGAGGMLRGGYRLALDMWEMEPSAAFGGMALGSGSQTETGAGPLSLRTQGQTLGSIRTVLGVAARRVFMIGEGSELKFRAELGWAHEYAATRATVGASFVGLPGSGFSQSSAPVGRDTALLGLSADLKVPGVPLPMFVAYSGGFANGATAQSLTAGVRVAW